MNIYTDEEFSHLIQTLSNKEPEPDHAVPNQRHRKEQVQMATILKRTVLELKKARAQVVDLGKEVERLKADEGHTQSETLKKSLIDLKTARNGIKELQMEVDKNRTHSDRLQQRIALLETEKQGFLKSSDDLEDFRKRQTQMGDVLKKTLDQLKEKGQELEQIENERNEVKRGESVVLEENAHLRVNLEEAKQEIQRFRVHEAMSKSDLSSYELKNSELGKEVNTLQELLEQTEAHFRDKQRQYDLSQAEQSALEIENQTLKIRINALEREYSEWDARVKELEVVIGENEKYAAWFQSETEKVGVKERQIETLQLAVAEEKNLKESAYQELQKQRLDFDNELMLWHERLTQEKRAEEAVRGLLKQKEHEKGEVDEVRRNQEGEIDSLRKKLKQLEQHKEEAKQALENVRVEKEKEINLLHEKWAVTQREKLTSDFENRKTVTLREEEVSQLRQIVNEMTQCNSALHSDLTIKNQLCDVLSAEFLNLQFLHKKEGLFLTALVAQEEAKKIEALKEKEEWQESWEKAKCEVSIVNDERLQTERLLRQVQDKVVQGEEESIKFGAKEKEWESAKKELETLWKQHQEKMRLTIETKDREIAQLKQTFKSTLEKSQHISHQTLSLKEREYAGELTKLKEIVGKSAQIEETQTVLIAKLQDEMRTAWLQAQGLQDEVEEMGRIVADKDLDMAESLQKMMDAQDLAKDQEKELVVLREEEKSAKSRLTQVESDLEVEKEQAQKLQSLANERLQWYEEQMKQWQERYVSLQARLQESQGQVASLEKARVEYEAFMNNFKSFVNKTMPVTVQPPPTAPVVEEPKLQEPSVPPQSLPFSTITPYIGKKSRSDLFDDPNHNRS